MMKFLLGFLLLQIALFAVADDVYMNFNGAYIGSSEDYLVSFDLETFRTDGLSGVFQDGIDFMKEDVSGDFIWVHASIAGTKRLVKYYPEEARFERFPFRFDSTGFLSITDMFFYEELDDDIIIFVGSFTSVRDFNDDKLTYAPAESTDPTPTHVDEFYHVCYYNMTDEKMYPVPLGGLDERVRAATIADGDSKYLVLGGSFTNTIRAESTVDGLVNKERKTASQCSTIYTAYDSCKKCEATITSDYNSDQATCNKPATVATCDVKGVAADSSSCTKVLDYSSCDGAGKQCELFSRSGSSNVVDASVLSGPFTITQNTKSYSVNCAHDETVKYAGVAVLNLEDMKFMDIPDSGLRDTYTKSTSKTYPTIIECNDDIKYLTPERVCIAEGTKPSITLDASPIVAEDMLTFGTMYPFSSKHFSAPMTPDFYTPGTGSVRTMADYDDSDADFAVVLGGRFIGTYAPSEASHVPTNVNLIVLTFTDDVLAFKTFDVPSVVNLGYQSTTTGFCEVNEPGLALGDSDFYSAVSGASVDMLKNFEDGIFIGGTFTNAFYGVVEHGAQAEIAAATEATNTCFSDGFASSTVRIDEHYPSCGIENDVSVDCPCAHKGHASASPKMVAYKTANVTLLKDINLAFYDFDDEEFVSQIEHQIISDNGDMVVLTSDDYDELSGGEFMIILSGDDYLSTRPDIEGVRMVSYADSDSPRFYLSSDEKWRIFPTYSFEGLMYSNELDKLLIYGSFDAETYTEYNIVHYDSESSLLEVHGFTPFVDTYKFGSSIDGDSSGDYVIHAEDGDDLIVTGSFDHYDKEGDTGRLMIITKEGQFVRSIGNYASHYSIPTKVVTLGSGFGGSDSEFRSPIVVINGNKAMYNGNEDAFTVVDTNYITMFDFEENEWKSLGTGLNAAPTDIIYDDSSENLYVFGASLNRAGSVLCRYVCRYNFDDKKWHSMGYIASASGIVLMGDKLVLHHTGYIKIGTDNFGYAAVFDGENWSPLTSTEVCDSGSCSNNYFPYGIRHILGYSNGLVILTPSDGLIWYDDGAEETRFYSHMTAYDSTYTSTNTDLSRVTSMHKGSDEIIYLIYNGLVRDSFGDLSYIHEFDASSVDALAPKFKAPFYVDVPPSGFFVVRHSTDDSLSVLAMLAIGSASVMVVGAAVFGVVKYGAPALKGAAAPGGAGGAPAMKAPTELQTAASP